jgi:hypothetical protein
VGQLGEWPDLFGGGRPKFFERGGAGFQYFFIWNADRSDECHGGTLRGGTAFCELTGGRGLGGGVGAFELGNECWEIGIHGKFTP